jgi:hypothetical protein
MHCGSVSAQVGKGKKIAMIWQELPQSLEKVLRKGSIILGSRISLKYGRQLKSIQKSYQFGFAATSVWILTHHTY